MKYAAYFLEGEANLWWQWVSKVYHKKDKEIRWKDFERDLMARFGPLEYTDYDEALSRITQKGTLREYQTEFKRIANRVCDWPESALVGAFIGGLKADLAAEVRVYRPKTYVEAIELARIHDDHLVSRKNARVESRKQSSPFQEPTQEVAQPKTTPRPPPAGVRRLP